MIAPFCILVLFENKKNRNGRGAFPPLKPIPMTAIQRYMYLKWGQKFNFARPPPSPLPHTENLATPGSELNLA